MTMEEQVNKLKEDFELLGDPNAIVEYIIELGEQNEMKIPDELKNDQTKIHGCASDAWMIEECKDGKVHFTVEGTSSMAKGMIPLMLSILTTAHPTRSWPSIQKSSTSLDSTRYSAPPDSRGWKPS